MRELFWQYVINLYQDVPTEVYEGLLSVFCIGAVGLIAFLGWKRGWKKVVGLLLVEYVFFIYCSTVIFRTRVEEVGHNFTPFWSYNHPELLVENIMNVVAFVPVGILIGVMADVRGMMDERRWKKGWQVALIVGTGLGISVSIETMQYFFHLGFSELDDVMHNTIGCFLGFGVTQIARIAQKKEGSQKSRKGQKY